MQWKQPQLYGQDDVAPLGRDGHIDCDRRNRLCSYLWRGVPAYLWIYLVISRGLLLDASPPTQMRRTLLVRESPSSVTTFD